MNDLFTNLGEKAAELAAHELSATSFGAIEFVELEQIEAAVADGVEYYVAKWRVDSLGDTFTTVTMVLLPEFIGDKDENEQLAEQMAAYIIEKVIEIAESE